MKNCPSCGKELDDDTKYCKNCGNLIIDENHKKFFTVSSNKFIGIAIVIFIITLLLALITKKTLFVNAFMISPLLIVVASVFAWAKSKTNKTLDIIIIIAGLIITIVVCMAIGNLFDALE